jgi:L-alanine-DL-glutamate epimerase-like enolase superfamily enzyme
MASTLARRTLQVSRVAMKFATPFRISGYVFEAMPSVIAVLGEGDASGRGEAAGVYYLGDDQDRMVADIEAVRAALETGADRAALQTLLPPCGARNALDCALWELESIQAGVPVWQLAGVPAPAARITTFTLPADDPAVLADKVRDFDHAKAIKLKLDGELATDSERVAVVRAGRPDAWLAVDANQGYSASDLDALEQVLVEHGVSLLEQPLPRGSETLLAGWRPPFPVAGDESILDMAELEERMGYFDVINIKLDKCGGLTEALAMAHVARAAGKQVMVGNMGGSTLAMAPGFVLAQLCDIVDLDGPYGLSDDPLAAQIYADGEILVPERLWGAAAD